MRLSTPCSRIRSSGGETSFSFFFSSSLPKTRVVASMAEAAIKIPPALMNFLRVAEALVVIDFSELRAAARNRDASAGIELVRCSIQGREQSGLFAFGHSHFILRAQPGRQRRSLFRRQFNDRFLNFSDGAQRN